MQLAMQWQLKSRECDNRTNIVTSMIFAYSYASIDTAIGKSPSRLITLVQATIRLIYTNLDKKNSGGAEKAAPENA